MRRPPLSPGRAWLDRERTIWRSSEVRHDLLEHPSDGRLVGCVVRGGAGRLGDPLEDLLVEVGAVPNGEHADPVLTRGRLERTHEPFEIAVRVGVLAV